MNKYNILENSRIFNQNPNHGCRRGQASNDQNIIIGISNATSCKVSHMGMYRYACMGVCMCCVYALVVLGYSDA